MGPQMRAPLDSACEAYHRAAFNVQELRGCRSGTRNVVPRSDFVGTYSEFVQLVLPILRVQRVPPTILIRRTNVSWFAHSYQWHLYVNYSLHIVSRE